MSALFTAINLVACGLVFAVAMFFFLLHDRPQCLRHHVTQLALLGVCVGAFGGFTDVMRGAQQEWWEVVFHVGAALFAAKSWIRWRRAREADPL